MKNGVFEIFDPIGAFGRGWRPKPSSKRAFTALSTIPSLDFDET